jgi:phosphatidylglycerophosphate synthase
MPIQPADIRKHKRVLNTLTSRVEKPALIWLASRQPGWMTPDILTGIGVFGAVVTFFGYTLSNYSPYFLWLATLGFVINWYGDSLDGTLARYRKIERPVYGFYIDHTTDAFSEILLFLGLGLSPYLRFDIACLALIGYLLLSVLVYVRTCVKGEFVISYGLLGPTEVRLIAIFANALVLIIGNPVFQVFSYALSIYDAIGIVVVVVLAVISITTTLRQARLLAALDS